MKKIISFALALCLAVGVMLTLTSCFGAIPSGTYTVSGLEGFDVCEFKVSGSKIVYEEEVKGENVKFTLTYKVSDDKIKVEFENSSYTGDETAMKFAVGVVESALKLALAGEHSFEKGDGYFKVGLVEFVKV